MEHKLIFKAIIGSQAQGTSTPESDEDYKGVYTQNTDDLISYGYEEFIKVSKDESYYEVKRFLDLLSVANPEALELLFSPEDCILVNSPQFELIRKHKDMFLTKRCAKTFANYAYNQIKKSKGTDKKINWEKEKITRKTPLDFCYIEWGGKTMPVLTYLNNCGFKQEHCGLVKLNHFDNCYSLYYDHFGTQKFKGLVGENSNELRLSSIPKEYANDYPQTIVLYYNKDGYTSHCKDYKSYQQWLEERNLNRFHTNVTHGQLYDSKNLSHCRRLIDVAMEIGRTGTFSVKRPNVEQLLEIKRGDTPLDKIVEEAERDILLLDEIYKNSNLPEEVDMTFVKDLLLQIRKMPEPVINVAIVCRSWVDFLLWKKEQKHHTYNSRRHDYIIGNKHYFQVSCPSDTCSKRFDEVVIIEDGNGVEDFEGIMLALEQPIRHTIKSNVIKDGLEPLNFGEVISQEHQERDDKEY